MKHEIFSIAGTAKEVADGMARAFFMSAFAAAYEEADGTSPLKAQIGSMAGRNLADVLPTPVDPAAHHAAFTLACDLRTKNDATDLAALFEKAQDFYAGEGDQELTPDNFGFALAMEAMGAMGTGLDDAFGMAVAAAVLVPHCEFGSHSLEIDYFG
jgi:hypothetical protein